MYCYYNLLQSLWRRLHKIYIVRRTFPQYSNFMLILLKYHVVSIYDHIDVVALCHVLLFILCNPLNRFEIISCVMRTICQKIFSLWQ